MRYEAELDRLLQESGIIVDLGQLDKGIELLHRCLQLAPGHSHAYVALGIACQKKSDLLRAKEYTMQSLAQHHRQGERRPIGSMPLCDDPARSGAMFKRRGRWLLYSSAHLSILR